MGNHRVDVLDDEDTRGELASMFKDLANGIFGPLSFGVGAGVMNRKRATYGGRVKRFNIQRLLRGRIYESFQGFGLAIPRRTYESLAYSIQKVTQKNKLTDEEDPSFPGDP